MGKPSEITRRRFIGATCALTGSIGLPAGFGALASALEPKGDHATPRTLMKLGLDVSVDSPALLRLMQQLGVEWVSTSLLPTQGDPFNTSLTEGVVMRGYDGARGGIGGPPGGLPGPWKKEEVARLIQQVTAAGLKLGSLYLHSFSNAVLGNADRDKDIAHVCESIRIAGSLGVPVLLYNFYGLRNVEGLYARPGRGGATYRAFDNKRVRDQSPLPSLGQISDAKMWDNLRYFLSAVIPVAKQAGVRLAQHPNDPPVQDYRGVVQPFATIEQWKRLVNFIPDPCNGIVLDTGVIAQIGGDIQDTIRYFGGRDCINHVHLRNARAEQPGSSYYETFIDEGPTDLLKALRTLRETGYSRGIVPDHSPSITGDNNHFGAWGYALGYIKALLHAAETG